MRSTRDQVLNKLRAARRPFPDADPRPRPYQPVTADAAADADALLERFRIELEALKAELYVVDGDDAARAQVLDLLAGHSANHILAWDFRHIPVDRLEAAIRAAGITITQPDAHDEFRAETLALAEGAAVGLTGADAAAAATGTLIVTTGPGKGRIPTVLAPVHVVVITLNQLLPRLEDWVAGQRAAGLSDLRASANICLITGASRTGDIEMQLVLGVHGPGILQVVVKR
jgi:L-lactate utilization protein LutC